MAQAVAAQVRARTPSTGNYFVFCTGETASSWNPANWDFDLPFNVPGLQEAHWFGQPDQPPEGDAELAEAAACFAPCGWVTESLAQEAVPRVDMFCYLKARDAGYDCGFAKNIHWSTCVVECEFGIGVDCTRAFGRRQEKLEAAGCACYLSCLYAQTKVVCGYAGHAAYAYCVPGSAGEGCTCHATCNEPGAEAYNGACAGAGTSDSTAWLADGRRTGHC